VGGAPVRARRHSRSCPRRQMMSEAEKAAVRVDGTGAAPPAPTPSTSMARRFRGGRKWRALRSNRVAMISLAFLVLMVLVAVFGSLLMTQDPNAQELSERLQGPSGGHWL